MASSNTEGGRHAAGIAARNVVFVLLQRGAQIGAGILFAAFVPRMMGPDIYGRYALITTLATAFAVSSSVGFTNVIGRYVPDFVHRGDGGQLQRFIGGLLTLRLVTGALAAPTYLVITVLWLRDVDPVVLGIMTVAVFVHGLTSYGFALLLGFDEGARWGMGETLRRWLSVILVIPAFAISGLRGASVALLAIEVGLVCLGVRLSRMRLSTADLRPHLGVLLPYLRFGLLFFVTHVLSVAFQTSGEPLVRLLTGDYAEVGYFSVAHNIYQAAAGLFPQLGLLLVPLLTRLVHERASSDIAAAVNRLLTWLIVIGVVAVLAAFLVGGSAVRLVIGTAYAPVAASLPLLMSALLMVAISSVTLLLTLLHERPLVALAASALRLVVFWAVCPACVVWWGGSFGASAAVLAASAAHAMFAGWRLRALLGSSLRSAAGAAALGVVFIPLAWLDISETLSVVLYGVVLVAYATLLLRTRLLTAREIVDTLRAVTIRTPMEQATDRSRLWRGTM